ncbi:hypothetical protein ACSLOF_26395, partial [Escherichia coli]
MHFGTSFNALFFQRPAVNEAPFKAILSHMFVVLHLSVKFGGKGQAANHADYIERKEKYRDRQDLEYSAHGNMPEW